MSEEVQADLNSVPQQELLQPASLTVVQAATEQPPPQPQLEEVSAESTIKEHESAGEVPVENQGSEGSREIAQNQHIHETPVQSTGDFLLVTVDQVVFTKSLYPGAIDQIEIKVSLKVGCVKDQDDQTAFLVKVVARCDNQEFNALDEYVYSVRYFTERLEFFEEVRFRLRQKTTDFFRVAVKVPAIKNAMNIKGTLLIQLEDLKPMQIPIEANCFIPMITPMKALYSEEVGMPVIKLTIKMGMKPAPIIFRNNSYTQLSLQIEIIGDNSQILPYDLSVASPIMTVVGGFQFGVQLYAKPFDNLKPPKVLIARKGLLVKLKSSCVYYCFPMEITFMDVAPQSMA